MYNVKPYTSEAVGCQPTHSVTPYFKLPLGERVFGDVTIEPDRSSKMLAVTHFVQCES